MVLELSPELESELELREGTRVEVLGSRKQLAVQRRRYKLEELLSTCDYSMPIDAEEREWIDAPAVGRELI